MTSSLDFRYHFTCIFVEGARFGHLGLGQTVSSGPMTKKMVQDLINSINSSEKVGTSELFESHYKSGHPTLGCTKSLHIHPRIVSL